jgi:nucleotide-binding universal stress UspA family protein
MTNVRTILVPVDFSAGSLLAIRHAHDLAVRFNSHLHLLHVTSTPDAPRWAIELFQDQLHPIAEQSRIKAADQLANVIGHLHLDPFQTTGLVRAGCAEDVIAAYADEIHADLIVMGVHGDRLIPQLRVGQVVQRVLGQVTCPVLAVPEARADVLRDRAADGDRTAGMLTSGRGPDLAKKRKLPARCRYAP